MSLTSLRKSLIYPPKKKRFVRKKPSVYQQKAICICRTLQWLALHKRHTKEHHTSVKPPNIFAEGYNMSAKESYISAKELYSSAEHSTSLHTCRIKDPKKKFSKLPLHVYKRARQIQQSAPFIHTHKPTRTHTHTRSFTSRSCSLVVALSHTLFLSHSLSSLSPLSFLSLYATETIPEILKLLYGSTFTHTHTHTHTNTTQTHIRSLSSPSCSLSLSRSRSLSHTHSLSRS